MLILVGVSNARLDCEGAEVLGPSSKLDGASFILIVGGMSQRIALSKCAKSKAEVGGMLTVSAECC